MGSLISADELWGSIRGKLNALFDSAGNGFLNSLAILAPATVQAPLHVGERSVINSAAAQVLISHGVNNSTGTGNAHGFSDSSNINRSGPIGYNSYDARIDFSGSQNYDHYVAFQALPTYGSSGTITNFYGSFTGLTVTNGVVTNNYAGYAQDPTGAGAITNNYGFYVENLAKGSTLNYAFYSAGSTPSYLGGNLEVDGYIQVGGKTSAYGGIARNGAGVRIVKGDNSADGSLTAGTVASTGYIEAAAGSYIGFANRTILQSSADGIISARNYAASSGAAIDIPKRTAPSAPAAGIGRLYVEDNGSGKMRVMILFPSGAAQQIAIEP